jgi:hypothetical protein
MKTPGLRLLGAALILLLGIWGIENSLSAQRS